MWASSTLSKVLDQKYIIEMWTFCGLQPFTKFRTTVESSNNEITQV